VLLPSTLRQASAALHEAVFGELPSVSGWQRLDEVAGAIPVEGEGDSEEKGKGE